MAVNNFTGSHFLLSLSQVKIFKSMTRKFRINKAAKFTNFSNELFYNAINHLTFNYFNY